MIMNPAQSLLLLLVPVLIDAITSGQGTCSSSILDNTFNSVSTVILDIDHTPSPTGSVIYDDVSFFTDTLGYDESEIDAFVEEALEFYLTRYGLDFTNSVPDANGRRQFENATLVFASIDPSFGSSFVSNGDPLVSRIKVPEYHQNLVGELTVFFSGPQLLRGTYGGEDGIYIGQFPFETLTIGFYHCAECPPYPLILPLRTVTPMRAEPYDGNIVFNLELDHPELGTGIGRGLARVDPTNDPFLLHFELRLLITFPTGVRC